MASINHPLKPDETGPQIDCMAESFARLSFTLGVLGVTPVGSMDNPEIRGMATETLSSIGHLIEHLANILEGLEKVLRASGVDMENPPESLPNFYTPN